jgi:co-chaperonin GroES (HSP10)
MGFDPATAPQMGPTSELQPRIIRGMRADYDPAPAWPGRNPSGLIPLGPNVLIRLDTCASATAGGVYVTEDMQEKMDAASESGCIYAIGKTAWAGYGADERPKLGDRVYFTRYSGLTGHGRDGGKYRVMDATCIACLIEIDEETGAAPERVGME